MHRPPPATAPPEPIIPHGGIPEQLSRAHLAEREYPRATPARQAVALAPCSAEQRDSPRETQATGTPALQIPPLLAAAGSL